ncbi:MAG TPA: hypothetical protein VEI96_05620 [Thermodesulfovibrionales bacterium]|nr:hypothetical protein [Thermodesulfovibrionales bacterium]
MSNREKACNRRDEVCCTENERRRDKRYSYHQAIEYSRDPDEGSRQGIAVNFSCSGLCMYLHENLSVGQKITVRGEQQGDAQKATVRWTRKVDENFFMAGLEYDDD